MSAKQGTKTTTIIQGLVVDVINNEYHIKTCEGLYQIPVGTVNIFDGAIIKVGDKKILRVQFSDKDESEDETQIIEIPEPRIEIGESELSSSLGSYQGSNRNYAEDKQVADWPEKPTKLLIQLYAIKKELVEERKIKTLKKMWELIREEMKLKNYHYTAQQCETKWRCLERDIFLAYKNKLDDKRKTGRGRQTCPYEKELSEILLKRTSIIPPLTLDASKQKSFLEVLNESDAPKENMEEPNKMSSKRPHEDVDLPPCMTPKKRIVNQPRNNIRSEIKRLTETMERRFEKRNQKDEKSHEQRERLIEQVTCKNDLLEVLIGKLGQTNNVPSNN